jgi:hypothetical protein
MAKKRSDARRKVPPQLVVRISEDLDQNLRKAADGLGLDLSGLVRMVLTEHVAEYVRRGIKSRQDVQAALAEASSDDASAESAAGAANKGVDSKRTRRKPDFPPEGQENRNMQFEDHET